MDGTKPVSIEGKWPESGEITPEAIEAGAKAVEASGTKTPKLPLRGMPFDRDDLGRATRHAFDAARRTGKSIKWPEARTRGYLWLMVLHFPSPFGVRVSRAPHRPDAPTPENPNPQETP